MLTIVFWDVQHGSATYINTPNNKHIVIDLGTGSHKKSRRRFSPLIRLKSKYNVHQLDGVIITHPHRDHLDDIQNLRVMFPRYVYYPSSLTDDDIIDNNRPEKDQEVVQEYLQFIEELDTLTLTATLNCPLISRNNGGVDIKLFCPSQCSTSDLNNHSIVTVITYAQKKVLIPGDNEPESWDELLDRNDFVSAIKGTNILLAPHHGRDSGYSSELFKHIEPDLTIISDGRFCDTSATDRYVEVTKRRIVYKKDGTFKERKCLTTRKDGVIVVKLGVNTYGLKTNPYMNVTID